MLQFLLSSSITIIFILAVLVVGRNLLNSKAKENNQTLKEYFAAFRIRFSALGDELIHQLIITSILTVFISVVSFRELWMNDAFHIILLSQILHGFVKQGLAYVLK